MATELLKRGANPSEKGYNGATPLHLVMDKPKLHPVLVKKLLKEGADLEAKDDFEGTPLWDALYCHASEEIVNLLLRNGADAFVVNTDRMTALHVTAQNDNTSVMQQLIEKGLSVNAQDRFNQTPLHLAAYCGNKDAAKVLIKNGQSYILHE